MTPCRKEDSDWMHDPRGKNRFSKLSYVERTVAALSAQTICSFPFSLLSSPSFIFSTRAGNSESDGIMTTSGSEKGNEYTVPGNLSVSFTARYFQVRPYEQKGGRKLYRVYIARWTSTMLFVRDWEVPLTKLLPLAFSTDQRVWQGKAFSGWISRRRTLSARMPVIRGI